MASSLTAQKLTANLAVTMHHHDPADATVATAVPSTWRSLAGLKAVLAKVMVTSAHAMVTFRILVGTSSAGAGSTEVVAHATPTTADALADVLVLEATIEQIKDVLPGATHYAVEIDMNNAAATAAVVLVEDKDRNFKDQTADQIA